MVQVQGSLITVVCLGKASPSVLRVSLHHTHPWRCASWTAAAPARHRHTHIGTHFPVALPRESSHTVFSTPRCAAATPRR